MGLYPKQFQVMSISPLTIIWILACCLQAHVNAGYQGDKDTFAQMVSTFGSQRFNAINNDDFIILADGNGITGKVAENRTFRVLQLLDLLVPDFAQSLGSNSDNIQTDTDNPLNFPIDNFTINTETNEFDIGTGKFDAIEVIPSFLTLRALTFIVRIGYDLDSPSLSERFKLTGFAIAGVWRLQSAGGLEFKISKYDDEWYFEGAPESGSLAVGKFAQDIATAILPSGGLEKSLRMAGLNEFTIENARFIGEINMNGFAIGLTGNPTIRGWGKFKCHLMVHHYYDLPYQQKSTVVTVGVMFRSFGLSKLIKRVSDIDITDMPFLGSVKVPEIGLVLSTGTVNPNFVPGVMDGILARGGPILKGVTIVVGLTIISDQPEIKFVLGLSPKDIRFTIEDPGATLTLNNLLRLIIPDFDLTGLFLPPGVTDILKLQLNRFQYQHQTKSIDFELGFGDTLVLIPDVVAITKPTLFLKVTLKKPRQKNFTAGGEWKLGSAKFPVAIAPAPVVPPSPSQPQATGRKQTSSPGFIMTASFDEINIGDIINELNVDFLPSKLQSVLTQASLLNFSIQEPFISIPIGTGKGGFQMQLSGRPQIGSWSGVTLNALVSRKSGKTSLALGLEFSKMSLAHLIAQLTRVDVTWISILDQSLRCAVVISPTTLQGVSLEGQILSQVPVVRGLSVIGMFSFPTNCGGDLFCTFMNGVLGSNATLQLKSTISSVSQFTLLAAVSDIQLGGGIVLSEAGLEVKFGKETSLGLVVTLLLTNPPIMFKGSIRVGKQALELEMDMVGIWKRAFGLDFLAFGNAQIKISLPVFGLAFGGELRLGKLDSGNEIIIAVYVGVNSNEPRKNYFFGSVNKASIGALMEAFDISLALPSVLKDSGFPNGLTVSYAGQQIEVPGRVIPKGFRLNGTLNILGFTVSCDILINVPTRIRIVIYISPLNLADGLIQLYMSRSDTSHGPMFFADIMMLPSPWVNVSASGYASVAGVIESEASLEITDTKYSMELTGRFFLFDATLLVTADYGSLQTASFGVYGKLSTDWIDELVKRVAGAIDKVQEKATTALSDAQTEVNNAQSKFDSAVKTLEDKKCDLATKSLKLQSVIDDLKSKQDNVNSLCTTSRCSRFCIGCPGWRSCCWRIWGACVGCPGWRSCCASIPDPICLLKNLFCKVERGVAYEALEIAQYVVEAGQFALGAATTALTVAQELIKSSKSTLQAANGVLEGVKSAMNAGLEAAKWLERYALGGLIRIRSIEFNVSIGLVSKGEFAGKVELSILNQEYVTVEFNLRLNSIEDMVEDLVKRVWSSLSDRRRREVADSVKLAFPDFRRKHYFPEIYRPGSYLLGKAVTVWKRATYSAAKDHKPQSQTANSGINSKKSSRSITASNTRRLSRTGKDTPSEAHTEDGDRSDGNAANNATVETRVLLLVVKQKQQLSNSLISRISVVDTQELQGLNPNLVISEMRNLTIWTSKSKAHIPNVGKSQGTDGRLPDLTACATPGRDRCATARDIVQLLADVSNGIQTEFSKFTNSVMESTKANSATTTAYKEYEMLEIKVEKERETLQQMRAELNASDSNGSKVTKEQQERANRQLSREEQFRTTVKAVGNELSAVNQTHRAHLVEQNAQIMQVMREMLVRRFQTQTTEGFDNYLAALFCCLEVSYISQSKNPANQEVLEIITGLRQSFAGLFDKTLTSAKKRTDDIERQIKALRSKNDLCE